LYIPAQAPFDLWNRDIPRGLKLYVHRIFIMDEAEQFLPLYLRFVRGVIDSNDLPLNVSREILQSNKTTEAIRTALTKRVLSMLEKLAEENQDAYAKFWLQFGQTLKEGVVEDHAQRELIAKLLRFSSTFADTQKQDVSLDAYISRMQPDQDAIYYLTADGFNAAQHSPHLEIFRDKGIEVLLLCDRIDEWLVGHLTEYQGKKLRSVAKGDLDLGQLEKEEDKQDKKAKEDELATLLKQIKEVLADKVKEVRITHRLTHSPACVVADDYDMSAHMQRILQAAGQDIPKSAPILELNPTHKFVVRLQQESDEESFKEWTHLLFEQALLAEGATLSDPAGFVQRMNKLLLESVA
jgi:molecular chaperone HtpG